MTVVEVCDNADEKNTSKETRTEDSAAVSVCEILGHTVTAHEDTQTDEGYNCVALSELLSRKKIQQTEAISR